MPRKVKLIPLPDEIWVMYLTMSNSCGSIAHVSHGDRFYRTQEECQHAIDTMKGWLGMGDRNRYHPMKLISCDAKGEWE